MTKKSGSTELSPQEIAIIKKVFNRIDEDGNGVIQISELSKSMKEIVPDVTDDEVEEIFSSTDLDKNGTIEFNEFLRIFSDWMNS
ncbi:putative EF-hand domain pair [Monocercomonoides exilis]|uniref:putative EF-hand domain pair n=1 Tax=Monocercomonoides exilis TaxID=2049356 RepID=UPI00355A8D72|nr:putative EF-hand domain pair [Monocercomonoides exilis]